MSNDLKQDNPSNEMETSEQKGLSRRSFIKAAGAISGVAVGSGAITGFPMIWAQNIKDITLRQFGTGVSNLNAISEKSERRLGHQLAINSTGL